MKNERIDDQELQQVNGGMIAQLEEISCNKTTNCGLLLREALAKANNDFESVASDKPHPGPVM